MGHYAAHLMNPMTGPKGCLPNIARVIWMRRHRWTPWLGHNEKPNIGNDWRITLRSIIEALDRVIQAAEEAVEHAKRNNLLRQEVIDAENELARAVQAKNS